ncbi:ABC transporter substrate-binding protein [uncultured Sulfitobacter sp.]|uniref:ABC transporter substrate-binding protein n=1 Tax=uncultured Sulfitobacter sp. TaxID=191468 RepID=UPI002617C1C4|nr:ABC transporter substrate-binding protein [uncultured Sulfitobacter sp.]
MLNTLFRGVAAAAFAALFALPAWAENITITDTLDRTVKIPEDPQRILLGFYYEDFLAVAGPDAFERVVAISKDTWAGWRNLQWKTYAAAIPRLEELADVGEVGSGTFSLEAVVAAKPDLAILAAWQYSALGEVADRIEAAGIPVVVLDYNAQTVEKHVQSTQILGQIMGAEERAKTLADEYAAQIATIEKHIAALPKGDAPKVYVELARKGKDTVDNSYSGTQWGSVINQLGAINIADGQISNWGKLSPEYVLAQNPQAILLAGSGWSGRDEAVIMGPNVDSAVTHERMTAYLGRPGWGSLDAVKNGKVFGIYHGGNRTLYDYAFLQFVAKGLYPDAFVDVDPQASLERFFKLYMPVEFKGTYMTQLP